MTMQQSRFIYAVLPLVNMLSYRLAVLLEEEQSTTEFENTNRQGNNER